MNSDEGFLKHFVNIKDVGFLGSNFYWNKFEAHGLTKEDILNVGLVDDSVYIRRERVYKKRVLKYGEEETKKLLNMEDMPHASGKTVDICLWDKVTNKEVYMRNGSDGVNALFINFYKNNDDEQSKKYQNYQDIVISAMLNNGFELGTKNEYFHFNLKPIIKNFDNWNVVKKKVDLRDIYQTFHESEIWWSSIGLNVGYEEDGKNETFERPVFILRKYGQDLFFGIPLSTKTKDNIFQLNLETNEFNYSVLLSQARIFSSRRLLRKIGKLSRGKTKKIKEAVRNLLKL